MEAETERGVTVRADAQRNRDQILAAAGRIILADGLNTPMEEIARAAGVGVGTLYRRFPDREALIRGLAIDSMRRVTELGEIAWAEAPDGWSALCRFAHAGGDLRRVLSAVRPHLIDVVPGDDELRQAGVAWFELLSRMVRRAQEEGSMRPDVSPPDVALMLNLLTRPLPGLPAEVADAIPDRFLEVMLEGLRADFEAPLSGSPIPIWWS
jgi:AcrR family transcriptional regulator